MLSRENNVSKKRIRESKASLDAKFFDSRKLNSTQLDNAIGQC